MPCFCHFWSNRRRNVAGGDCESARQTTQVIRPACEDLDHEMVARHSRLGQPHRASSPVPTGKRDRNLGHDRRVVAVCSDRADNAVDQGRDGDAAFDLIRWFPFLELVTNTRRDDRDRDHGMLKTPVGLVTVGLTVAILLAASLLIVTGTHGEDRAPAVRVLPFQAR
jgi:hypothetical protein